MARPRGFDEDIVIESAMLTFWKNGYEATSIGNLEEATGISRISIYNAFGDKFNLFIKALDKYSRIAGDHFLSETFRDNGLRSIIDLFEAAPKKRDKSAPEHFGCLMLNTILDINSTGPAAKKIVDKTRQDMIIGFEQAMKTAVKNREMQGISETELHERAEFLVGALWGGRMTARLDGDVRASRGVAKTVINVVKSW